MVGGTQGQDSLFGRVKRSSILTDAGYLSCNGCSQAVMLRAVSKHDFGDRPVPEEVEIWIMNRVARQFQRRGEVTP